MGRASRSAERSGGRQAQPPRPSADRRPDVGPAALGAERQLSYLQRSVGNDAVSTWLASLTHESTQQPSPALTIQRSLISWAVKMGAKKVSKGTLKNFINTQIRGKLKALLNKDMVKRFGKEADDILEALEDPWWATAIGFVPLAGDAFDLARLPAQIRKAFQRAERLEAKVSRVLALQGKKAADVIPGTLKRSASYASELENLTYGQLRELASTDSKAAAMKKLIENEMRLMEKL